MGNVLKRTNYHDLELQRSTSLADQYNVQKCDCVNVVPDPDHGKCLHSAIKERNFEKINEIIRDSGGDCLLARNADGEIPLHTACKDNENNDIVVIMLGCNAGSDIDGINYHQSSQFEATNEIFGNTALHIAACLGNEKIVSTILGCQDGRMLLKKKNKIGDTPVHGAASRGHVSVLELMYQKDEDCINYEGRFKGLPLHSACGYGRLQVVLKLLEWDKSTLEYPSVPVILPAFTRTTEPKAVDPKEKENIKYTLKKLRREEDRDKHAHYTPLTRACQFGHVKIASHLLEIGAIPHPLALIKAIEGLYRDCVQLILFNNTYRKYLLHFPYKPDRSLVLTTPFRELIKHMPEVAETVLQRSVELERFLVNSESFKIKLSYEFVDDNGHNLNKENENVNYIDYTHHYSSGEPMQEEATDYDVPPKQYKSIHFNKETHPLSLMVKYKRDRLLTHPVVAALIHDKWKSIYGVFSFAQWFIYIVFLCCTTTLLFKLPNPSSTICIATKDDNVTQLASNASCSSNATDCSDVWNQYSTSESTVIALASIVLTYSVLRLLLEGIQLAVSLYQACSSLQCGTQFCWDLFRAVKEANYIWNLVNWVEVPLFILSIIFCGVVLAEKQLFCLLAWQW